MVSRTKSKDDITILARRYNADIPVRENQR